MNIFKDLQIKFKTASIVQQLIYINVAAFIITLISSSFSGLYGKQMSFIYEWFSYHLLLIFLSLDPGQS